jgi:N-hydroxyarylamine O-acetyltransferase
MSTFDLDAYLERIGLSGRPSLAEVHHAHSTAIPFENIDPYLGVPVSLATEDLERKLVRERRGGYCFEQNLLLAAAMGAMGAEVELYLGRVRVGAAPGVVRPRGHLVLMVSSEGARWHADVGFGRGTPFHPLPFGPGGEHEQLGWRYRIVEDGPELVLQSFEAGQWLDLYAFPAQPVPPIDVETINWWVCTHPRSPFVTGLLVGLQGSDGVRSLLSDWEGLTLGESSPTTSSFAPVQPHEVGELLASRFSLPGFELGPTGRLRRAGG